MKQPSTSIVSVCAMLMLLLGLLAGCGDNASTNTPGIDPDSLPQGSMLDEHFTSFYAFYNIGDAIDTAAVLKAMQQAFPDIAKWDTLPDTVGAGGFLFNYFPDAQKDYIPSDSSFLAFMADGFDDAQKKRITASTEAVLIGLVGNAVDRWTWNRTFCKVVGQLAAGKQWAIYDEGNRAYLSPARWQAKRVDEWTQDIPALADHFSIHAYREESGLCRCVTVGMEKFALPNIVMNDVSCSNLDSYQGLMNLVAQQVAENDVMETPGVIPVNIDAVYNTIMKEKLLETIHGNAVKRAMVAVRDGEHQDGDAPNRLLEIYTYDPAFSSQQVYQDRIVSEIFGSADKLVNAKQDDDELQAASDRARNELPRLAKLFRKGLGAERTLLVKLPFSGESNDTEYMWVEVTEWKGEEITGILQNDPYYVKDLHAGDRVTGKEADVFDYLLNSPNGSEGNETGKILEAR